MRSRLLPVIDAAAQFAASALQVSPGDTVIEIGAGRGTKCLLAASSARRLSSAPGEARTHASIIAVDLHPHKLQLLQVDSKRLGYDEITTCAVDATASDIAARLGVRADKVLVDAPCSGLGTLRRHPDRRWRGVQADVHALAELSTCLLQRAADLVKPGGTLVYSTCTITNAENQAVISAFLESPAGSAFRSDPLQALVPEEWRRWLTDSGAFQSVPTVDGCDGHYVARLKRM